MSTALFFFFLLLLSIISGTISGSSAAAAEEDQMNPMQQSSEAEMVRLAGYGDERLSSVLVTGSLLCEACLQPGSVLTTSHVKGAKVGVACKTEGWRRRISRSYGRTDEYGEFIIELPSRLHAIPKLQDACVVRVLRMPKSSLCRRIADVNPSPVRLSSVGNSIRVYTAGTLRASFRGNLASRLCSRKNSDSSFTYMQTTW